MSDRTDTKHSPAFPFVWTIKMTTENTALFGWIVGAVGTTVGTLGAVVATLFRMNESKNAEAIKALEGRLAHESAALKVEIAKANERAEISDQKHDECLRDREELRVKMAILEGTVKSMQQCRDNPR